MEYYTLLKIREEWDGSDCTHPKLEKVRYSGAFLISYACVTCGKDFTIAEKMEFAQKLKQESTE